MLVMARSLVTSSCPLSLLTSPATTLHSRDHRGLSLGRSSYSSPVHDGRDRPATITTTNRQYIAVISRRVLPYLAAAPTTRARTDWQWRHWQRHRHLSTSCCVAFQQLARTNLINSWNSACFSAETAVASVICQNHQMSYSTCSSVNSWLCVHLLSVLTGANET